MILHSVAKVKRYFTALLLFAISIRSLVLVCKNSSQPCHCLQLFFSVLVLFAIILHSLAKVAMIRHSLAKVAIILHSLAYRLH